VWWSFNYPRTLASGSETAEFYYGPDRQKWKQTYSDGSNTETTYYFDNLIEQVNAGSVTDWRHSIYAGGKVVAVYSRDGTNNTLRYVLSDHQGSVSSITTNAGATYANESFTAYGKRRDASDWSGDLTGTEWATLNAVSRTGYTGHGQIGTMNLNHMNGRVQDAVTGVFLSADPYVTDPGLTQNYHRYGYVYNNPLSFTDPSGFACETVRHDVPGYSYSYTIANGYTNSFGETYLDEEVRGWVEGYSYET